MSLSTHHFAFCYMGVANPTTENTIVPASKYARIERERRFLLDALPTPLARNSEHIQIWDNYLDSTRLRLRKIRVPQTKEYRLKLTQKEPLAPGDFSRYHITNTYLSAREYNRLATIFTGGEIRKNRYPFEYEGRKYGVDVFLGALWGLMLAETDFTSDEEMAVFVPPPFVVREVTHDEKFTGGQLHALTLAEIY